MSESIMPILNVVTIGVDLDEIFLTLESVKSLFADPRVRIIVVVPFHCETTKLNLPYCHIFQDEGLGIYPAMNMGLSHCSNSYVWFLNAGDTCNLSSVELEALLCKLFDFRCSPSFCESILMSPSFLGLGCIPPRHSPFLIRVLLASLFMPASHQNIIVPKHLHSSFSTIYRYGSDFALITDLFFSNKAPRLIVFPQALCHLSPYGLSDLNRYGVLKERLLIVSQYLPNCLLLYSFICLSLRLAREAIAHVTKTLLHNLRTLCAVCRMPPRFLS